MFEVKAEEKYKCNTNEHDSDGNDDEVVYVAMKDESDEDEATVLMTCVNKNEKWIIDSGCSLLGLKIKALILSTIEKIKSLNSL